MSSSSLIIDTDPLEDTHNISLDVLAWHDKYSIQPILFSFIEQSEIEILLQNSFKIDVLAWHNGNMSSDISTQRSEAKSRKVDKKRDRSQ